MKHVRVLRRGNITFYIAKAYEPQKVFFVVNKSRVQQVCMLKRSNPYSVMSMDEIIGLIERRKIKDLHSLAKYTYPDIEWCITEFKPWM